MKLLQGNNIELLKQLPDNSVDAVVTDPPYGLGKEPDALAMLRDWLETGHHDVKGKGFMGKAWDAFVPQPQQWREIYRVLKPGGHVLAFAGTRTQDLMALGLRLAGFEIRDLVAWVYGSGFPKSLDVSKAIDKAAGAEREVIGKSNRHVSGKPNQRTEGLSGSSTFAESIGMGAFITAPATDAARLWQGWGTALKPALEPITLARKPLEGTVAENVLKWHTGAVNVDGCRVGSEVRWNPPVGELTGIGSSREAPKGEGRAVTGRWPANLIHDGSKEVTELFPVTTSGALNAGHKRGIGKTSYDGGGGTVQRDYGGDSGSAARFFKCCPSDSEPSRFAYVPKASKKDRDEGIESCVIANRQGNRPGSPDETGKFPDHDHRERTGNFHPTVKPTDLMRYLCRLITPPGGVVLDPWMGSGSTGKAAKLEGFDFIGMEMDKGYFDIACARTGYKETVEEWI